MAITHSYDEKTEAIINPNQIVPSIDGFPTVAVVTFSTKILPVLYKNYTAKEIDVMKGYDLIPIYEVTYKDKVIAFYCSMTGGAMAASLLEEMISKGCKKFIYFGACGVLDTKIDDNLLIIPIAAYRDEGTSYHYAPASDYINNTESAHKLSEMFSSMKIPHILGKTWTTDAIYRETHRNMEKRINDGCVSVEMECASIMSVAQFRNVQVYQFLYSADKLSSEGWQPRTFRNLLAHDREKFLRIAMEVATKIQ